MAVERTCPAAGTKADRDAGFSLIEALVVLAVSGALMVALTSILNFSRVSNMRLADHAARQGDMFYTDLQAQSVVDRIYEDPLLQVSGRLPSRASRDGELYSERLWQSREGPVLFSGDETSFTLLARSIVSASGDPEAVTLRWDRTDDDGSRLVMVSGEQQITWPTVFPDLVEFRYMSETGEYSSTFPVKQERPAFERAQLDPVAKPTAIMAVDTATQIPSLILDVP
ncbi:MAG: prepilin-type N-terminal cleavage/methylation domain-containing protein [Pseudomonadota bacterium]